MKYNEYFNIALARGPARAIVPRNVLYLWCNTNYKKMLATTSAAKYLFALVYIA